MCVVPDADHFYLKALVAQVWISWASGMFLCAQDELVYAIALRLRDINIKGMRLGEHGAAQGTVCNVLNKILRRQVSCERSLADHGIIKYFRGHSASHQYNIEDCPFCFLDAKCHSLGEHPLCIVRKKRHK